MSSTATVLTNLLPTPEPEPCISKAANVGTGTEDTGKCSVAPLSLMIGSWVTIGEAPASFSSVGLARAGAAAATWPPVLAAIGCASPRDLGAHNASATGADLPSVELGMDSSSAASLGSGTGMVSWSSSSAANGTAGACASGTAGLILAGLTAEKVAGSLTSGFAGITADREGTPRDFATVAAAAVTSFASFFRSSPRPTRNVLFDCSILIGLVSTRFAPMRNALATPACPSTTATESEL